MAAPLVHLVDAHVYIFRAYAILPGMEGPDGVPTGAAYGFANTLIRYLAEENCTHVACCADYAMTSFRNERFPGYKASRGDEVPEDLAPQFEMARQAATALGVPVYEAKNFEADDVIGTLTTQLLDEGARVVIVSSDKDLAQLVTEDGRVTLYDLQRDTRMDADAVREKFGVDPARIPDYLALVGDRVDDLPGVPGFGKKSAAAALNAFGELAALPDDPDAWRDTGLRGAARLAKNIAEHRAQALEMRELATVVRNVPGIHAGKTDLARRGPDQKRWKALCRRLGWKGIQERAL